MSAMSWNIKKIESELIAGLILLTGVFIVTVIILILSGAPPFAALGHIIVGCLGSWIKFSQVLKAWIPLCLCSCGLLYTFRIGLWNIGIEGQIVAGAIAATAVMRSGIGTGQPIVFLCLAFLAGFIGGGLWAVLAGLLKTKGGVNEIFAGLGLNFVAQGITMWLIFGPWKRPGVGSMSGTEPFPTEMWLPVIASLRISPVGLTLTALTLAVTGYTLSKTRLGLALKAIGGNSDAAFLHGLKPGFYMPVAMALAGGFAGLAGIFQVADIYHRLIPSISSNYGYLALLVVMLANYRTGLVPVIALFFACLNVGSIQLPLVLQLDSSLIGIIQGTLVIATLLLSGWRQMKQKYH